MGARVNARRIRALKLARELMRDQIQHVSFDANLHEKYKSDCPVTIKAYKERAKLRDAVAEIEKMMKESA
jgi:hypothetical protein